MVSRRMSAGTPCKAWEIAPAMAARVSASPRIEQAARMVKEQMDKKYNENWIVIIGKGFSFEVTHEVKHVLWMYNCDIGVLCYKAGARQVGT